jgi:hypothetical protein
VFRQLFSLELPALRSVFLETTPPGRYLRHGVALVSEAVDFWALVQGTAHLRQGLVRELLLLARFWSRELAASVCLGPGTACLLL